MYSGNSEHGPYTPFPKTSPEDFKVPRIKNLLRKSPQNFFNPAKVKDKTRS